MRSTDKDDSEVVIVIRIPRAKLREGGHKRWKGVTREDRRKVTSAAGKTAWANLTPEERSAEMKRRARVRNRNRKSKS